MLASSCLVVLALAPAFGIQADVPASPAVDLPGLIARFEADRSALRRKYDVPLSEQDRERLDRFFRATEAELESLPFEALDLQDRIDASLLANELRRERARIAFDRERDREIMPFIPYAGAIVARLEAQERGDAVDPVETAEELDALAGTIRETTRSIEELAREASPTIARRAADRIRDVHRSLSRWFRFHDGYDPLFSWWVRQPWESVERALEGHVEAIEQRMVRASGPSDSTLIGDPIGREALVEALAREMIPYSPEELVSIAELEFAWCRREREKATRELGFEDWREALDHVKGLHVPPGEQPALVRQLAQEAIDFLAEHELVTVPPLAAETWRLRMMSAERQQVNPYFTGGEVISVSYPTHEMDHQDKLMSMRGNNIHFSRATVHHELIPGHHLQQFMTARYRPYRRVFSTPFWTEGWALYWEMLLWDLGFPQSPADRMGMLFWRSHRCARIVFSLSFHLGEMSALEAVDYLVENVGHERRNATAEVRRSVGSAYSPLYQAAYMVGGLQFRSLHEELVGSGEWSNRGFHDRILRQGNMPVEMVRAVLLEAPPEQLHHRASWRFYDLDGR